MRTSLVMATPKSNKNMVGLNFKNSNKSSLSN